MIRSKNGLQSIRNDLLGGLTAAVVALPLALAFGIASGAGALAGLYASIFGGLVAAVFGGCGVQITGPTGAMIAVLTLVVSEHGIGGMLLTGALAGFMQVLLGLFRLGAFVRYLPRSVVAGFTNGVAILFFMTAVGDALNEILITVITVVVIVIALRFFKKIPESLLGLVAGLLVNEIFIHSPHLVGDIAFKMPQLSVGIMPFEKISTLLMPALTICLLGSISSLLSAEVTDGMLGTRHNSNKELIGQGLANIISSLVGGIPVSGAVARSGVNVYSGGRTRLSGIMHSIFLILMILILGPIVKRIPLATLAAILMVASVRTADWKSLKLVPRARYSFGVIMIITTVLTVVKDLTIAVVIGTALAGISVLVELASLPNGKIFNGKNSGSFEMVIHPNVEIITFHGPLFFVGVENMKNHIREASGKPILVLDFSDVPVMDESGALVLRDILKRLHKEGKSVYITGLNRKPLRMLLRMGVVDHLGRSRVCKRVERAVKKASREELLLNRDPHGFISLEGA